MLFRFPFTAQLSKCVSLILFSMLVASCASVEDRWPEGIPEPSYFRQYYAQDSANQALQSEANYLRWIKRFYTGVPPIPGWLELAEQTLDELDPEQARALQGDTYQLGRDISGEWAKNHQARRIDTRMINVWRDAFLEARRRKEVPVYLELWKQDVDALLSGSLSGDEIYFERYYVDEFDF